MTIEILMPALSPTMEKGTLVKWCVKEGDKVDPGDIIAEIETDKATMEVEAVDSGMISKILVKEGTQDVPVNELIALFVGDDEELGGSFESVSEIPSSGAVAVPVENTKSKGRKGDEVSAASDENPSSSSSGVSGTAILDPCLSTQVPLSREGRIFVSPLARRVAGERGIDLGALRGSGPRGRIIMRDVEDAAVQKVSSVPTPAHAASSPVSKISMDAYVRSTYNPDEYEDVPHNAMRKTIARRLTESKQTIPHFYLSVDCELDAMLTLRGQFNKTLPMNDTGERSCKLSVNDFIIKALALALREVPMANATWLENSKLLHKYADVGVAVAIPDGLFTPVIRKADMKSVSVISAEMKDFARRAREKKLKPEEYQGGSTAISNLGMYGVKDFKAVINPPQSTILAVGAGGPRPVVRDGGLAIAQVMSVTLSCDHRVVDGAVGADLLRSFKLLIENPIRVLA
ncbi:MAG: pyruvate dehydrogenase complex dihydrolipoamide acetyltransferase [Alphaproteobacteria bacterium]|nr:pyruvate dehydrogenase complex dihydrolipoamide acetyltransferase [Alphaproteobacteria bacterium]